MTYKNKVLKAAVDLWGLEPQMLMVGEEAVELSHAVFKWRRAYATPIYASSTVLGLLAWLPSIRSPSLETW